MKNKFKSVKELQVESFKSLKEQFKYKNIMQSPRLVKAVISVGVGSFKDKKKFEIVEDRLMKITGQKIAKRGAKKAIANFKTRLGDTIGYQVTLRGARMYGFLDKLFNIAFPRTKDFRGIERKVVDNIGNITLGIKEHTIFPESVDEELKDVFGFAVTVVSTAKNREEGEAFFEYIGVPFKKK